MKIILLILALTIFEPVEISDWELTTSETNYKIYYSASLKTSKWTGCTDPNYSWNSGNLSWEREVTDEEGKKHTITTYKDPIEIIANFQPASEVSGVNNQVEITIAKKFGPLKDFIWLDNVSGGGTVIFPSTSKHIFLVRDRLNPIPEEIHTTGDNYYEVIDGKTYVHVESFSGVGMAAGTSAVLIGHWKMDENTASDNDELVTGGTFTTWVSDDPSGWAVTGEVGADPMINEVGTGQGQGGAGTGYCNLYTSDGTNVFIDKFFATVIGRKYTVSINVDTVTTGSIQVVENSTEWATQTISSHGIHAWTYTATITNPRIYIRRTAGAACDVTFDDVSVKLCAVEDSSGNDHDGLLQEDTDAAHVTGKINGAFDFDGSSDFIEIDDTSSDVKSIAMWVNPDAVNVTDSLIDLNGTDYITIVNGTVTQNGFGTGTQVIYVDSVVASTVTTNWHFIVLTSTDGFTADDLDIGREGSNYYDGDIDNVMIFSTILTPDEVDILYNGGAGMDTLHELDYQMSPRRTLNMKFPGRRRYSF